MKEKMLFELSKRNLIVLIVLLLVSGVSFSLFNIDTITGKAPAVPSYPELKIEILKANLLPSGSYNGKTEETCILTSGTSVTCKLDIGFNPSKSYMRIPIRASIKNAEQTGKTFVITSFIISQPSKTGSRNLVKKSLLDSFFDQQYNFRKGQYTIETTGELKDTTCNSGTGLPPMWGGSKVDACWDKNLDPFGNPNPDCTLQAKQNTADTWCKNYCGKQKAIDFKTGNSWPKRGTRYLELGKYCSGCSSYIKEITCENPSQLLVSIAKKSKTGSESGTVTGTQGNAQVINCVSNTGDCTEDLFSSSPDIILTATPDQNSLFDSWGADCSSIGTINTATGIGTCVLSNFNTHKKAEAIFRSGCSSEVCDGLDNDCDGAVDEDVNGNNLIQNCNTGLQGICSQGTQICLSGSYGQCTGQNPRTEDCNGLDDDCDNLIDEDVNGNTLTNSCYPLPPNQQNTLNVGQCYAGTQTCTSGAWGQCTGYLGPSTETCNGADDDCDNLIDEDVNGNTLTQSCYTGPTGTQGVGQCRAGTQNCQYTYGSNWGQCYGETLPTTEICSNGLDENCDSQIDESTCTIDVPDLVISNIYFYPSPSQILVGNGITIGPYTKNIGVRALSLPTYTRNKLIITGPNNYQKTYDLRGPGYISPGYEGVWESVYFRPTQVGRYCIESVEADFTQIAAESTENNNLIDRDLTKSNNIIDNSRIVNDGCIDVVDAPDLIVHSVGFADSAGNVITAAAVGDTKNAWVKIQNIGTVNAENLVTNTVKHKINNLTKNGAAVSSTFFSQEFLLQESLTSSTLKNTLIPNEIGSSPLFPYTFTAAGTFCVEGATADHLWRLLETNEWNNYFNQNPNNRVGCVTVT